MLILSCYTFPAVLRLPYSTLTFPPRLHASILSTIGGRGIFAGHQQLLSGTMANRDRIRLEIGTKNQGGLLQKLERRCRHTQTMSNWRCLQRRIYVRALFPALRSTFCGFLRDGARCHDPCEIVYTRSQELLMPVLLLLADVRHRDELFWPRV